MSFNTISNVVQHRFWNLFLRLATILKGIFPLTPPSIFDSGAPQRMIITNNNNFLYVCSGNANIDCFLRGSNGVLHLIAYKPLFGVSCLVATPNSAFLYAYFGGATDTIYMFSINALTGVLTSLVPASITTDGDVSSSPILRMAVSSDGADLYVGSKNSITGSEISHFSINSVTGQLTRQAKLIVGSVDLTAIALSSDGLFVYASDNSSATIYQFSRNITTGALAPLVPAFVNNSFGLTAANDLNLSYDGNFVYCAAYKSTIPQRSNIDCFLRNPVTGALSLSSTLQLIPNNSAWLTISPDNTHIYHSNVYSFTDNNFYSILRDVTTGVLTYDTPASYSVGVGGGSSDIVLTSDHKFIYVGDYQNLDIAMFSNN